jgi:hypothetical protein
VSFLDIQGSFDNVTPKSTVRGLREKTCGSHNGEVVQALPHELLNGSASERSNTRMPGLKGHRQYLCEKAEGNCGGVAAM